MEKTYKIEGVHCNACLEKIKAALQPLEASMEFTLKPPTLKINLTKPVSLDELNAKIASAGNYRLVPMEEEIKINPWKTYYPLFLIVAYITSVSLVNNVSQMGIHWHGWMNQFMAGFFLVFSAFKFLDLSGFADAYASYDVLAKRWRGYGFIYPFLELGLGFAYLMQVIPNIIYVITIVIMGFSSIGVAKAIMQKRKIRCACLGTVLNLPMTSITLVEDLTMVVMAMMMLISS